MRGDELRLILVVLRSQGGDVMFDAATIVAHVGDLLFQARNFCIGLIQHTLTRMQRVTRAVVLTAQFFETFFGLT